MSDYLAKPVELEPLEEVLARWLVASIAKLPGSADSPVTFLDTAFTI
jgi:response regulator of citrate/malate metabolism